MQRHFFRTVLGRWALSAAVALLLVLCLGGAAAEETRSLSFRQIATPAGATAVIYDGQDRRAGEIGRIDAGGQCEVIGAVDAKYLRVRYEGQTGYVRKSELKVGAVPADVPDAVCDTVSLVTATPTRHDSHLVLQGAFTADAPVEALFIYMWDESQQRLEHFSCTVPDAPADRIDAALLKKAIPLNKYSGGMKTLVVEGCTEKETLVLFRAPVYLFGALEEPVHVTELCGGLPPSVTDGKVSTAWAPKKPQPSLTVQIPERAHAALLTLEWKTLPGAYTVALLDEQGSALQTVQKEGAFYLDSVPLDAQTRTAVITPSTTDAALSTVRVYGENYPSIVQEWEPLPEKLDILLVSTHQDDEFLFFGGTIPYYASREDVTIGVLYMADCGRLRHREALNGLWSAGLRHYPVFLELTDEMTASIEKARSLWRKDDPEALLVQAIRRYRPEVIVCQDLNGEYGHGQHKYTAELVTEAVTLAADAGYHPESAEEWGTWQIKKCYVHLYEENQIRMDWNVPLDENGAITPMFLAWAGFDKSKSQIAYFSMERDGVKYDNTLFGLYYSAVGPDVEKNDFMENVR